ncbi:MAG: hypothetical protein IKV60_02740, partial [Rikenellaceae bacterium]|nr:hypothetical protein [Rikenellaceae bacterium]
NDGSALPHPALLIGLHTRQRLYLKRHRLVGEIALFCAKESINDTNSAKRGLFVQKPNKSP